eukprot:EG_transcript_38497
MISPPLVLDFPVIVARPIPSPRQHLQAILPILIDWHDKGHQQGTLSDLAEPIVIMTHFERTHNLRISELESLMAQMEGCSIVQAGDQRRHTVVQFVNRDVYEDCAAAVRHNGLHTNLRQVSAVEIPPHLGGGNIRIRSVLSHWT